MNAVPVLRLFRRFGMGLCFFLLALPVASPHTARALPLAVEIQPLVSLKVSPVSPGHALPVRRDAQSRASGWPLFDGVRFVNLQKKTGVSTDAKDGLYPDRSLFAQPLLQAAAVQTAAGALDIRNAPGASLTTEAFAAPFSLWSLVQRAGMPGLVLFLLIIVLSALLLGRFLYGLIKSERLIRRLLQQSEKTDIIKINLLLKRAVSVTHFAFFTDNEKKAVSLDDLALYLQKDLFSSYAKRYKDRRTARHAGFEEQIAVVRGEETFYYTLYCLMLSRHRCLISLTNVTEETLRQQQLEKLAGIDPLTGLYDQQHFKQALTGQMMTHPHASALLLILNLRNFSEIIDRYSYTVGDDLLLGVSEQLKLFPYPAKILGRLGGDTFALLLCDLPSDFSTDFIYNWSLSYEIGQSKMDLPVYGGLCLYPADAGSAEDLFNYALFATELARLDHNARVLPFNHNAYSNHLRYQEALEAYPEVVQSELFYPIYQPVVSLHTGGRFGYEAFTRCSHSAFPDIEQLIVVSRNVQDIDRLTILLLKKSYDAFPFHRHPQQKLFIKMCFGFVTDAEAFWNKHAAILDNINFNHLVVEVTERYEIVNYKEHDALLAQIKARGGTISLDDYGEGYSNEASLIRIRPAIVKLASTLVSCVDQDEYKRSFIHKFVQFAWKTDTLVLAEGVETQEEFETLKTLKVDMVQGYLLGKPEKVW